MNRSPTAVDWTKGQRNVRKFVEKVYATDTSSRKTEKIFHIILTLFWITIYLTGVVLTALTGRDLYNQYQQNPVSLAITPMHNETMMLPNPTICLPFFEAPEEEEYFLHPSSVISKKDELEMVTN